MESFGTILKSAREEKNLDFATVSRDTTISPAYLNALEEEDTSVFPGEPYFVGFLKNYAEYLGVDSERIITLYRAKTVQESPVPEGLIVHERPRFVVPLVISISMVFVIGCIIAVIIFRNKWLAEREVLAAITKSDVSKRYELTDKPFQGRVFSGDQLIVSTVNGEIVLTVADTVGKLGIETPIGIQYIELSEEIELDIDGDSVPELIIYVTDVSSANFDRGSEARILLKSGGSVITSETKSEEIPNVTDLPAGQSRTVILEDTRAYPFTVTSTFRGGCVFRYRPDRKDVVEDYFSTGDVISTTASNGIRMWISNGAAVKRQVIANSATYDIAMSKAGEVVAQDIRWIRDTDGKYKLVVAELD